MSGKRSRVVAVAAAGTLTLTAAVSAAATMLPSDTVAAPASAAAAYMTVANGPQSAAGETRAADTMNVGDDLARLTIAAREHAYDRAVANAAKAAAKRAAAKEAAAKEAAVEAAKAAAAQQAAAVQAAPKAQATPAVSVQAQPATSGSAQQIAEQMLSQYGWPSSEFSCLEPLWAQESGWSVTAENPSSGAYGIPQAMPGAEMASAGAAWQTDAATQISWGLTYIKDRYGSPCGAWAHEESTGWY